MRFSSVFIVSLAFQGCAPKETAEEAEKRTSRNRQRQTSSATSSRTQPSTRNGPRPDTGAELRPELAPELISPERPKTAPVCRSWSVRSPFVPNQHLLDEANRIFARMNHRFTSAALPAILPDPLACGNVERSIDGTDITVIGEAVSSYAYDESNVVPARLDGRDDLYMLKYRLNCDDGVLGHNDNHPLVRNYKAARLIHNLYPNDAGLHLTPAALFISDASPFDPVKTKGIVVDDPYLCVGSQLRYLVMKAAGPSLASLINSSGPATLNEALVVGLNLVRKLKRLHAHGIIHGDIHWRNVLMSSPKGQGSAYSDLVLVDWDQAIIPGLDNIPDLGICSADLWTPSEISSASITPSLRSDLFRVYDMMALMMGKRYDRFASEGDLLKAKSQNYIEANLPKSDQITDLKYKSMALHDLVMNGFQPTTPEGHQPDLNKAELLLAGMIDITIQISMSK